MKCIFGRVNYVLKTENRAGVCNFYDKKIILFCLFLLTTFQVFLHIPLVFVYLSISYLSYFFLYSLLIILYIFISPLSPLSISLSTFHFFVKFQRITFSNFVDFYVLVESIRFPL